MNMHKNLLPRFLLVAGLAVAALGCGSQSKEPPAPNGSAGDAKTETPPPAPTTEGTGGIQCSEESRKAEMCTQQYDPVCADVDTGVRCVTAPCPQASERKTFSNACVACQEPKVIGYRKGSCEGGEKATQ
ncbi:MAG: hypothetical protein HUU21_27940 [Polyangiaceae bacterium]|nr:hypothetical protein [Polyangiaceae bacterium]